MAELLWEPDAQRQAASSIGRFARWAFARGWVASPAWDDVWSWSVTDLEGFWSAVAEWGGLAWSTPPERVFAADPSAGAGPLPAGSWCPGGRLNYATGAVRWANELGGGAPAVLSFSQTRQAGVLSWSELATTETAHRGGDAGGALDATTCWVLALPGSLSSAGCRALMRSGRTGTPMPPPMTSPRTTDRGRLRRRRRG